MQRWFVVAKCNSKTEFKFFKSLSNNANRFNHIRNSAKKLMKDCPRVCENCEYDIYVEVCHVKSICDFPECSTIKEINNPENLILLCRNCHTEFDRGDISIDSIRKKMHPPGNDPAIQKERKSL